MLKLLVGREYPDELLQTIQNCKTSLKILMYDWRWYSHQPGTRIQKVSAEIIKAKNRAVDVRVILNFRSIVPILKRHNIKVFEKDFSKKMHIKVVVVDDKIALIGSHNLTVNGFELNHEMSIITDDEIIVSRCSQYFNNLCHL